MKIGLSTGFKLIPEGNQTLKIISAEVTPKAKPKQLELKFQHQNGGTNERSYDWSKDIELFLMTLIVRFALGDMDEFDTDNANELVGKYVEVLVEHTIKDSTKKAGETVTFANVTRIIGPGKPWDKTETKTTKSNKPTPPKQEPVNDEVEDDELDDLLNDLDDLDI